MMKARNTTPTVLRPLIAAVAHALRPHVSAPNTSPTRVALEVSRNLVASFCYQDDDGTWIIERRFARVADVLDGLLAHRVKHGWISVSEVRWAASDGAMAWVRVVGSDVGRAA